MYCRFLLLSLFAAVVTSQNGDDDECFDAARALAANGPCANAVRVIGDAADTNSSAINIGVLNAYCTPSCRALNNAVLSACANLSIDTTQLYCTVDGDMSCYDVVTTFTDTQGAALQAEISSACSESPTDPTEMCTPGCTMAVQNFLDAGGCCFVETLDFVDQFVPDANIVGTILSACPGVSRPQDTCEVITGGGGGEPGGSAGLMTSGIMLIITATIVASVF